MFFASGARADRLRRAAADAGRAFVAECEAMVDMLEAAADGAWAEFVAEEIALALSVSPRTAGNRLATALELACRPAVADALVVGYWTVPHATVALHELAGVPEPVGSAVERWAVQLPQLPPAQLGRRIARRVAGLCPDLVAAREEQEARTADVRVRPRPGGMADLVTRCTAAEAVAALKRVQALASAGSDDPDDDPDDDRTAGRRHADAVLDALGTAAAEGVAVPVQLDVLVPGEVVETAPAPRTGAPEPVRVRVDLPTLLTALHAERSRLEHLLGDLLQQRAGEVARDPLAEVTAAVTAALGEAEPEPHPAPDAGAELLGHGPISPRALGALLRAADGRVTLRRLLVDAGDRLLHLGDPARTVTEVLDAPADVPVAGLRTDRYRPGAALQRFVQARDVTCSFPGCPQPAEQCDLDHLVPWPRGATTPSNLQALCRHHHRLKHTDGWTVARDDAGGLAWRPPAGRPAPRP